MKRAMRRYQPEPVLCALCHAPISGEAKSQGDGSYAHAVCPVPRRYRRLIPGHGAIKFRDRWPGA